MDKRVIIFVLVAGLFFSCRGRNPQVMERAAVASAPTVGSVDMSAIDPGADGTVEARFEAGRSRTLIHKESNETVYLAFDSEKGRTLRGRLTSKDPDANVRISQIILPDGTMDGPFGWDISYELPESGTYKLAIHENMMAGSPWEGDFKVELALK